MERSPHCRKLSLCKILERHAVSNDVYGRAFMCMQHMKRYCRNYHNLKATYVPLRGSEHFYGGIFNGSFFDVKLACCEQVFLHYKIDYVRFVSGNNVFVCSPDLSGEMSLDKIKTMFVLEEDYAAGEEEAKKKEL